MLNTQAKKFIDITITTFKAITIIASQLIHKYNCIAIVTNGTFILIKCNV
jgi:hypothetical protein